MIRINDALSRPQPRWHWAALIGLAALAAHLPLAEGQQPKKLKLASLAEFSECADNSWSGEQCLEALHAYVKAQPARAFDAGKAVTMKYAHWAAIPFFEKALATQADPTRCKDERLAMAVASAIGQPNQSPTAEAVASGTKILSSKCWNELREPIAKRIAADNGANLTRNACPVYAEKKEALPACQPKAKAAPKPEPPWEALDPKQIQLEGSVKVYSGHEGRRISLAKVKGKAYYLIKFEGVRGPWNDKVVLHREDPANNGYDYVTQLGPTRRYAGVTARRPWGETYDWEIYPLGGEGPYRVSLDEKATKAAKAETLLAQFGK